MGMSLCPGYVPLTGNRTPALGRTEEPRQLSHSSQALGPRIGRLGACRGDQRSPLCALRSPSLRPAPSWVVATAACPPLAPLGAPPRVQSFPRQATAHGGRRCPSSSCSASQLFAFVSLGSTECFLATAVAQVAARPSTGPGYARPCARDPRLPGGGGLGALLSAFHAADTSSLPFGGPRAIDHFFRDIPAVLRLAGAHARGGCVVRSRWALTALSRARIVATGARRGRGKARSPRPAPQRAAVPRPRGSASPRPALLSLLHSSPS